jgi:hypothetical protein
MIDPHTYTPDRFAYIERVLVTTLGRLGCMIDDIEYMRTQIGAAVFDVQQLRKEYENGETYNVKEETCTRSQ